MPQVSSLAQSRHRPQPSRASSVLFPLDVMCARAGLHPPTAREVTIASIPEPYAGLLGHERDMTGTLERYHAQQLVTRPLSTASRGRWYSRHVLLSSLSTGRPLAVGAIRVRLDVFGSRVQARIRESEQPFGRILSESGMAFVSRPTAYFEIAPNSAILGVFWMVEPLTLYGRRTELSLDGDKIGDVVEVLPRL